MPEIRDKLNRHWIVIGIFLLFVISVPFAIYINEIDTSTFFGLFIPAFLGVAGSYAIYLQRLSDRRNSLRQALKAEIEGTPLLHDWPPEESKTIPSIDVLTTTVFEENSADLGILTDQELSAVIDFYTRTRNIKEALKYHGKMQLGPLNSLFGPDIHEKDRRKGIMKMIDGLAIRRHLALIELDLKSGVSGYSDYPFSEGAIIQEDHLLVKRNPQILVRYGLLKELNEESDKYVVTSEGEELFKGELSVSDIEAIEYFLGGLDEWIPRVGKSILRYLLRFLNRFFKSN